MPARAQHRDHTNGTADVTSAFRDLTVLTDQLAVRDIPSHVAASPRQPS